MTETVSADELNVQENVSDNEVADVTDDLEDESPDNSEELERLRKENERLAKYEARYKANKKAESQKKPVNKQKSVDNTENIDLNAVVEQKIAEISEKNTFKSNYWEDVFNDVAKIKEQHPTLTWEQAKELSPVRKDPARTANANETASPWRANTRAYSDSNTITLEALSKLPINEYKVTKAKVDAGEIKIKG